MAGSRRLGAKIKQARAERGWKQKHLAAEVSVEPITVSRWERGATTPDLDVLGLVAEATGKPVSFFVEETSAAPAAGAGERDVTSLHDAVARIETAAVRIANESERIAALLEELRVELTRARSGAQ